MFRMLAAGDEFCDASFLSGAFKEGRNPCKQQVITLNIAEKLTHGILIPAVGPVYLDHSVRDSLSCHL
jgi:hypothetical protein